MRRVWLLFHELWKQHHAKWVMAFSTHVTCEELTKQSTDRMEVQAERASNGELTNVGQGQLKEL